MRGARKSLERSLPPSPQSGLYGKKVKEAEPPVRPCLRVGPPAEIPARARAATRVGVGVRAAGAGPRPQGARRPYVLQLVFPPEPDAGAVVLLLDAAVEVRAHSGQARRGLFGAAFEPHLLEALVGGGREPLVLPDLHPDMTRRRRRAAGSG